MRSKRERLLALYLLRVRSSEVLGANSNGLARPEFVSVIEVRLRGITRKFKCLLSLVANHRGIAAGFSAGIAAAASWGNNTCADREQQDR